MCIYETVNIFFLLYNSTTCNLHDPTGGVVDVGRVGGSVAGVSVGGARKEYVTIFPLGCHVTYDNLSVYIWPVHYPDMSCNEF